MRLSKLDMAIVVMCALYNMDREAVMKSTIPMKRAQHIAKGKTEVVKDLYDKAIAAIESNLKKQNQPNAE